MFELPERDPCDICETLAGRSHVPVVAESELTFTVVNPIQFETGQCCVVTRRHVATLLDLTDAESAAVLVAAREVAHALLAAYRPKGILTFQNNGVYSGQLVPHYHFHVVPRQPGSDWGIGPPQLRQFTDAGRIHGTPHDSSKDDERRDRARVDAETLHKTAALIRESLQRTREKGAEVRR
jgi:diadenosine tetraphosphate (Ap4A) HIT family hydrolase